MGRLPQSSRDRLVRALGRPGRKVVFSSLIAVTVLDCGGRSSLADEWSSRADNGRENTGGTSSAGAGPVSSVGLDTSALAAERCADFPLPATGLAFLAEAQGFPRFGACGHLTLISNDPAPIWSPDLSKLVPSALDVSFSPEGTRAIFVPGAPENDRVRRLDLPTMQTFDTEVPRVDSLDLTRLNFGLFIDNAGDVESWVCSNGDLRIFADRTPSEPPLLETSVPSCSPVWINDATLFWQVDSGVFAVDLRGYRVLEQTPPPYRGGSAKFLMPALDGYAVARESVEGPITYGPLFSMRDGSLLATGWENLPLEGGANAANRLEPDVALLVDDGDGVISVPGLRGLYVFRDKTRAFAFRANPSGAAELVFVDLLSGETTPIAEYSRTVLDPSRVYAPSFRVSPGEHAAYFVLQPDLDASAPIPANFEVARWMDGTAEVLSDTVPPSSAIAVADDGTAVFMDTSSSIRIRPGTETLTVPRMIGLNLSHDGAIDLASVPAPNQLGELVATNLDDGTSRVVLSNLSTYTEADDLFHERHAILLGMNADTTPHELWAGRFPSRE